MIIMTGSYFIVRKILDILETLFKMPEKYCDVTLALGEQRCRIRALVDSGNNLFDNISGKPVHIISSKAMKKLTKENQISMVRYIPYCTIQKEKGILPVVKIDKMWIHQKAEKEIEAPLIGIATQEQFAGGTFEMILHPKDC